MKKLIILGSTGSIGRQALDIIRRHRDMFQVVGLSTHKNVELLMKQVDEFGPKAVAVSDHNSIQAMRKKLGKRVEILGGESGLVELSLLDADLALNALVGSVGLESTIAIIKSGKDLALANKESMVVGGEIINHLLTKSESNIIPVDSEHSAIYQCLLGEKKQEINKVILTASGGPFKDKKLSELKNVTPKEALAHPRWNMGKKISIDSATLMNKGLEVIEAHFLFKQNYDEIEVIIHPQSIIHSMVEFMDGSIKAHLGPTDMRIPIQYAFSYPERLESSVPKLNLLEVRELVFEKPNLVNFPCLEYAIEAGRNGKSFPAVLNAANEEAVEAFLKEKIPFLGISKVIYEVLSEHKPMDIVDIKVLKEVEGLARGKAKEKIDSWRS
ncbi:MAG TPA: 1-deoxy-D-xylulose-5-phosphate reductoisomerase [Actinobacteria bacterium]|nr:1-deoxy-D-xylulose-5-phosphate reductoisomerase [Actinomycetota bacterium]